MCFEAKTLDLAGESADLITGLFELAGVPDLELASLQFNQIAVFPQLRDLA